MISQEEVLLKIKNDEILNSIKEVFAGKKVWLVGGFIRDLFLGKTSFDRDIVCLENSRELAQSIAQKLNGSFVELDLENEIYRVVLEDKKTYFDVSLALENDIKKDSQRRDFNVNSIFYDFESEIFLDLRGGILDIENKIISTSDLKNLEDDPLRMLRAFRFASILGFKIDCEILNFIKENYKLIKNVAQERVSYEFLKLFEGDSFGVAILDMDECGLLSQILPFVDEIKKIPPNTHHHLNLFNHCLESAKTIRIKNPLLRFATFCHDVGKPQTHTIEPTGRHRFIGHDDVGSKIIKPILAELKFSKKQIEYVSKMIKYHIYPSALMADENVCDNAKIRFIRKLDPHVEDILELARADRLCARGPMVDDEMVEKNLKSLEELHKFYLEVKPRMIELPKLLDGNEIMKKFNLKPSPKLGEVLDALKEAQIEGKVSTKEGALEFVANICKDM